MSVKNTEGEVLKAGCVVIQSGKVLLVTNKDRSVWAYPKGHVETGETLQQTALRETLEETGYSVRITRRLEDLTYRNGQTKEKIRVALFLAIPIRHSGKQGDEIYEWKVLTEAKELVLSNLTSYLPAPDSIG